MCLVVKDTMITSTCWCHHLYFVLRLQRFSLPFLLPHSMQRQQSEKLFSSFSPFPFYSPPSAPPPLPPSSPLPLPLPPPSSSSFLLLHQLLLFKKLSLCRPYERLLRTPRGSLGHSLRITAKCYNDAF